MYTPPQFPGKTRRDAYNRLFVFALILIPSWFAFFVLPYVSSSPTSIIFQTIYRTGLFTLVFVSSWWQAPRSPFRALALDFLLVYSAPLGMAALTQNTAALTSTTEMMRQALLFSFLGYGAGSLVYKQNPIEGVIHGVQTFFAKLDQLYTKLT